MKIKISSVLDIGKRENNEDDMAFCPDLSNPEWRKDKMDAYISLGKSGSLAVIADGMGGANAGEVASSIAIKTVKEMFSTERTAAAVSGGDDTIKSLLEETVKKADSDILARIAVDDDTRGMGTTIVICWLLDNKAYIAWCGDSRCYVFHPVAGLKALSHDHSVVQELVDKGEITPEEAFYHPDGNIITRGLGDIGDDGQPDVMVYPVKLGDTLILCSDGLCGYCEDKDIQEIMDESYLDVTECSDRLLKLTLDAGGHDNIAIIVQSVIGDDQDKPAPLTFFQRIKRRFRRV